MKTPKTHKELIVEVIVGVLLGALACAYLVHLTPEQQQELSKTIWMLGD